MPNPLARLTTRIGRARGTARDRPAYDYSAVVGAMAVLIGVLAILGFSLAYAPVRGVQVFAVGVLVGGAALAVGVLVGFLFGIPRTLAAAPTAMTTSGDGTTSTALATTAAAGSSGTAADSRSAGLPAYAANSNLDSVSDWLTKILIGVGLTQVGGLGDDIRRLAGGVASAFAGEPGPFAITACVYFGTIGFLWGYLWTRTQVAASFRQSDLRLRQSEEEVKARLSVLPADDPNGDDVLPQSQKMTAADRARIHALGAQVREIERAGGTLDADGYRRLARQLKRAGQFLEAEEAYLRAAALDPRDPAPLNYAGVIRSKNRGDTRGAEELFKRALSIDPTYTSAFYNWACTKARAGEAEAALKLLTTTMVSDPTKYRALALADTAEGGPFHRLAEDPRFLAVVAEG